MINVYDRKNKKYISEVQYGSNKLKILYETCFGRCLLKLFINPIFSKTVALYKKSIFSKKEVKKFIKNYNIDMSLYEDIEYKSFNDFFTRKLKKENIKFINNDNYFISPADAKLLVYKITDDCLLNIKNSNYTLNELVKDKIDLSQYNNGLCLIFRLSMDNYHHYCYPDGGILKEFYNIKGVLHTVSSISKNYKIYKENKREISVLETNNFDNLIFIEVGALLVGDINNNHNKSFSKGEEKGYFSLGGSTIIVLVKDGLLRLDEDIVLNSNNNIETKVQYCEKIGEKLC